MQIVFVLEKLLNYVTELTTKGLLVTGFGNI